MTEERALYTTDEVMQMRVRIELQRKQLAEASGLRTENELLRERVEALRKTVDGFTDAISFQWAWYQGRIKELEGTVARLEAEVARKNGAIHALDQIAAQLAERLATLDGDA